MQRKNARAHGREREVNNNFCVTGGISPERHRAYRKMYIVYIYMYITEVGQKAYIFVAYASLHAINCAHFFYIGDNSLNLTPVNYRTRKRAEKRANKARIDSAIWAGVVTVITALQTHENRFYK